MERGSHYFNEAEKRRLRSEFNNHCAHCFKGPGQGEQLQVHHALPTAMGGVDQEVNGVALDKPCHKKLDKQAFEEGLYFDKTTTQMVPIEDAPDEMFQRGVNRFREVREELM